MVSNTLLLSSIASAFFGYVQSFGLSDSGTMGSVYYDGSGSCGKKGDVDSGQGDYSTIITGSAGSCGYSIDQIGNNGTLVAIDVNAMSPDLCGKEVKITKADGTAFEFSGGKFFVGEACPECGRTNRIDLSAKAVVEYNGGSCTTNAMELSYEVLNNYIGPLHRNDGEPLKWPDGTTGGGASNSATSAGQGQGQGVSSVVSGVSSALPGVPATTAATSAGTVVPPEVTTAVTNPSVPVQQSVPVQPSIPSAPSDTIVPSNTVFPSNTVVPPVPVPDPANPSASVSSIVNSAVGVTSTSALPSNPSPLVPGQTASPNTAFPGIGGGSPFGNALFAEGDTSSGSAAHCKRRKRRLNRSH